MTDNANSIQLVIIGAVPGGYEAAYLAADLGMKVTLIDKEFEAGIHHLNWNSSARNASGVYFYRLWTNGFSQIRRMLLLK